MSILPSSFMELPLHSCSNLLDADSDIFFPADTSTSCEDEISIFFALFISRVFLPSTEIALPDDMSTPLPPLLSFTSLSLHLISSVCFDSVSSFWSAVIWNSLFDFAVPCLLIFSYGKITTNFHITFVFFTFFTLNTSSDF